jgi:hypothetical protein
MPGMLKMNGATNLREMVSQRNSKLSIALKQLSVYRYYTKQADPKFWMRDSIPVRKF